MSFPKIILYKSKTYSDGTHPIMIQVVKNGKAVRKVISRCKPEDWLTNKARVSSRNFLHKRINFEIEQALQNFGLSKAHSFKTFFELQNENYKLKQQVGRYHINQNVLRQIIAFKKDVDFEDIDESFIYKFAAYLRNDHKNGVNTIEAKMTVLSTLFRKALKAKLIKENPFTDITFKRERTIKDKLNVNELRLLMNADLQPKLAEVRDMFLACMYLRGLRIGDLLRLTADNIQAGRITYVESKTGKQHSSAIIPELHAIIDRWRGNNRDGYIFSLLKVKQSADPFAKHKAVNRAVAIITSRLKRIAKQVGIDKNLTSHIARHSFAVLANQTIQNTTITKDLIGHATLAIHEAYITEVKDDIIMDGYANQVFNLLKN